MYSPRALMLFVPGILLCFPASLLAAEASLNPDPTAIPAAIAPSIQEVLNPQAYAVSLDGGVVALLWFRKEPAVASTPSTELGVTFGGLQQGSVLGVIEVRREWDDYKGTPVPQGVFTMRYLVQPADGAHMGISSYRDFAILGPAAEDTDGTITYGYADLVALGSKATGVPHPAVLALFPVWDEVDAPKLLKNELDQWTVATKLGAFVIGFVLAGQGGH